MPMGVLKCPIMPSYLFPLKDRREIAEGTMAFWFDTSGTDFSFKPGQYANFEFADAPNSNPDDNSHVFSLASSPHHKDSVMIAVRMRDSSAFKAALSKAPLGTKLKVSRPLGKFLLHEDPSKPAVFLAGGIGITPFLSIVGWHTHHKSPHRIRLFYSNRTPASTAFLQELSEWEKQNPNFQLIPTVTDVDDPQWKHEQGFLDEEMIRKYVSDMDQAIFYVVGPPAMVDAMDQLLQGMEIPKDRIRLEKFDGY